MHPASSPREPNASPLSASLAPKLNPSGFAALLTRQHLPWLVTVATCCVLFGITVGHEPLWLDETYSFAMTQHSVADLLRFTTRDVHPPLYYLLAKVATVLFGPTPIALRLPSVLAAAGLLALAAGPVRQLWGQRVAAIFCALLLTSPGILCFAQEGRMYATAAFFVTGAVLYGQLALAGARAAHFVALGVFTWCAAMTHYFGLVAVAINGLLLLATAQLRHESRLKPLLVVFGVCTLAYVPWLMSFIGQVSAVSRGFWIPPTSLTLLAFGLVAPFTYKFEDIAYPWQAMASFGIAVVVIALTFGVTRWRSARPGAMPQLQLVLVFLLTLGFGLAFSWIVQPVFMPRYMMSCAGLLLLAAAVALGRLPGPRLPLAATALLVALNLPAWLRIQTQTFNGPFELLAKETAAAGEPAPILLHNDGQALYPSWFAVTGATHVTLVEKGAPPSDPTAGGLYDGERLRSADLDTVLSNAERVWIVDAEPAGSHIDPTDITKRPGWVQRGEATPLALPMSWVKLNLLRFERVTPIAR